MVARSHAPRAVSICGSSCQVPAIATKDQYADEDLVRRAARWRQLKILDEERAERSCRGHDDVSNAI
ncbi:MAG: hypothetical protein K1X67_06320 [Fimbriimonadaceae bacterium]|nr:hypothetical protein [Fimbriimonadaceae bacterium]